MMLYEEIIDQFTFGVVWMHAEPPCAKTVVGAGDQCCVLYAVAYVRLS